MLYPNIQYARRDFDHDLDLLHKKIGNPNKSYPIRIAVQRDDIT
jgi:hypothetical protein